jgi:PTS system nitrogen regulatory IIA component
MKDLPDILTIEEVAEYLRVSERTVYDWAQKGEIPCGKLGTTWRFKKDEIEKWISRRLEPSKKKSDFVPLFFDNVLTLDRVMVFDKITKNELLEKMIDVMAKAPEVKSKDDLREGIFHREQLMSTGIGLGVGIPHVRLKSVKDIILAVALVHNGIDDYESMDSVPVKLVFMIVARDDQHGQHIKLLSQISSRLKEPESRQRLISCADSKELYGLLTERSN